MKKKCSAKWSAQRPDEKVCKASTKAKKTLAAKAKKIKPKGTKTCKSAASDLRVFKTSAAGKKMGSC
jgi:3D (Asp-Asp-Asp) domain-containing protein